MVLPEMLLRDSVELFTRLLASAESTDDIFFGLNASDQNLTGEISRASAQLIEICSWLGLLSAVKHRLAGLVEFLQNLGATDPKQMYAHPSRLRALLLIGEFDHASMENSIRYLLDEYDKYLGRGDLTRLAYTDFMGTFVHYAKTNQLPSGFPSRREVIRRATRARDNLLRDHWNLMTNQKEKKRLEPRDLSYAMWLLFLNEYYDKSRTRTFRRHLDYLEKRTREITNDETVQKYRRGRFARIIYPHLFLCFIERKSGRVVDTHPDFLNWLSVCARHLTEELDGYHGGLLMKQVLAIDKYKFLSRYLDSGVSALIKRQIERGKVAPGESSLLAGALRQSTKINLDHVRRLTGGWSEARVYRVDARVLTPLSREDVTGTVSSYAVKIGKPDALRKAAMMYDTLPDEAKRLFAAHDGALDKGIIGPSGDGYVVIEWLEDFEEYASRVRESLPDDPTQSPRTKKIMKATESSLLLIGRLHLIPAKAILHGRRPPAFHARIANLLQVLDSLSQKETYLDVVIKNGVPCGSEDRPMRVAAARNTVVRLLNKYHNIPLAPVPTLLGRRDVIVHGDCHGNNIMMSSNCESCRFIDIGDVHVDDYLIDYAQLAAHVCFSMNLEEYSHEELTWFTEPFGADNRLGSLERLYPARWTGIGIVWEALIKGLRSEIEKRESFGGFRRFAFYLADRLIFVASKSPSSIKALILHLQGTLILSSLAEALVRDPKAEDLQEVIIPPGENVKVLV